MLSWLLQLIAEEVLGGLWEATRPPLAEGACPRCRRRAASTPAPGCPSHLLVCVPCVRLINRNLNAGGWFFLSLGLLMGALWVMVVWMILWRVGLGADVFGGKPVDWGFVIAMPPFAGVLALIGYAIRGAVREPPTEDIASSQETIDRLAGGRPTIG